MQFKTFAFLLIAAVFIKPQSISAQSNNRYIRIAKLVIDPSKMDVYKAALREHAEVAVKAEPGVLMLYAVYEKEHPEKVSVFEIYASEEAYRFHITTPHFLKYKTTVQDMVKSLELIDVMPIALQMKLDLN